MGGKSDLSLEKKHLITEFLLANSYELGVRHCKIKEAAETHGVCVKTVQKIWNSAKAQLEKGMQVTFVNKKLGAHHPKKLQFDTSMITSIPFEKRGTIRRLARELTISKSHVGRWVKAGVIRSHSNAIKPELTQQNITKRLNFCLSQIQPLGSQPPLKFSEMYNVVHIDEKWFYMSRESEKYYIVPGEIEPHRTCKSKRYIPKIMFMCAVSRPIFSGDGECVFDGKIGIWPFTKEEPAKRNSKNRLRGTLVTKPIESITKEVIKNCLVHQVIPAIKEKWPVSSAKNIVIQQDNAKPHISNDDADFISAAASDGFNIQLMCQPPNSPDMNVNDLGWFRAIQSLQYETASYTTDDLIKNVLKSFENLSSTTLNSVFLTLQGCIIEVMKAEGTNKYKIPHMGKERLAREGRLPVALEVEEQFVRACLEKLNQMADTRGLHYNIRDLMASLGY